MALGEMAHHVGHDAVGVQFGRRALTLYFEIGHWPSLYSKLSVPCKAVLASKAYLSLRNRGILGAF
jgi:hypothetical protein